MLTHRWILFLLLPLILALGCKSKQNGTTTDPLKKRSSKYLFEKVDKYHVDASWFSAKSSIRLVQGNKTTKATAYIRMREDSVIWASVKKLGVEGGRMLVTPDSVFLINRLDKYYMAKDFDYIREMAGMTSTGNRLNDFRNLYDLLLGNVVLKEEGKYKVDVQNPHYVMSKEKDAFLSEYWLNGDNYTLNQMSLKHPSENKHAYCFFGNYKTLASNQVFSYLRKLDLYSKETGPLEVELNFSKIKINEPVSIRFSIPDHYDELAN